MSKQENPPASDGPDRFLNRELSWLEFNGRVLALAEDAELPLLERVKFVAICARNLDEFFQVRVAGLKAQIDAGVLAASPDGQSPSEQLQEIRARASRSCCGARSASSRRSCVPRLAAEGISFVDWDALTRARPRAAPPRVRDAHPSRR